MLSSHHQKSPLLLVFHTVTIPLSHALALALSLSLSNTGDFSAYNWWVVEVGGMGVPSLPPASIKVYRSYYTSTQWRLATHRHRRTNPTQGIYYLQRYLHLNQANLRMHPYSACSSETRHHVMMSLGEYFC